MQVGNNTESSTHTRCSERSSVADGQDTDVRGLAGDLGDPVGSVLAHEDVSAEVLGVDLQTEVDARDVEH